MAFSYRWADLILLVSRQVKNIPTQPLDALHCDLVSSRIAQRLPWKPQQQTIAPGQIPLVDGVQDYDPPFQLWRMIDASLRCLSSTPHDDITISVRDSLPVDFYSRSPYAITSVSLEAGIGRLRLSSAVYIPEGAIWELRGTYQINPTKVVSTQQFLWFDDRYAQVAVEGLTYWYYKLADDPRAGSTSGTWPGDITYTGQLAQFMSGIKEMADAEDIGGDMQVMPEAVLGVRSSQYGAVLAGYGFGGGGNGGSQNRGLVSINGDTTPAQNLIGGIGISVTNTGIGSQMISWTGSGGEIVAGITSINASVFPAQTIVGAGVVQITTSIPTGVTTIYVPPAAFAGLQSINADTTSAQQIVGAGGITVSTVNGVTTIAGGGVGGGPVALSTISFTPSTVIGGNSSTCTVTLTGIAPAGGAVVTLTNSNFDLVTGVPATVTVPVGASSTSFSAGTVTTASQQVVTITGNYGGMGASGNITLTPPAAVPLVSITLNPTTVQGGNTSTATVTLAAPSGPQGELVALSSSDTSVAQVPTGGVEILAGTSSATFTVSTTAITGSSSATISATYGNTVTATLSVTPGSGVTLVSLTLSPSAIVAGQTSTGTVTISGSAPAGGVVVALTTSSDLVTTPATVTVPVGQTTATFTVNTSTSIGSTISEGVYAAYAGVSMGFGLIIQPLSDQWIYGGGGQPGATGVVGIVGNNQVALSTGDVLDPLQNGAEQVGQSWTIAVSNQAVYLLLIGGTHTFVDANTGFPFAMNPPIAVDLGGRAMFLYQSTNALYGAYSPKVTS